MDFERVWEDLKARRIPHDKVFRWLYTLGIKDSNRRYFKHMSPDAYTEEQEAKWDEEAARAKPGPGEHYSENYERYYEEPLKALSQLLALYMQSGPTVKRDRLAMGPIQGFPTQPTELVVPERKF